MKQFQIVSGPNRVSWYTGLLNGNRVMDGWAVCFQYNAKSSYGAYAGLTTAQIVISDDVVVPRALSHNAPMRC